MRHALLLLLMFCCASCSPAPVLQLTALNPAPSWTRGRIEAVEQTDSLEWRVVFEGTERDDLVFAVAAWNRSTRPRLVDPSAFSCTLVLTNGKVPRGLASPIPARDPERVLRDVSIRESSVLADQRSSESFDGLVALVELADDLANGATRTEEEQRRVDREHIDRAEQQDRDQRERHDRLHELAQMRDAWTGAALRRTRLAPGDSVAGRVYLPASAFAGIPVARRPGGAGISRLFDETDVSKPREWVLVLRLADESNAGVFRYSLTRE